MNILVIDGQGGGIGKSLIERLRAVMPEAEITAAGTNSIATSNMMRAGANQGATGENAVIYNCVHAEIIVGPIGIILANSMLGEITPPMACAVSSSEAKLFLVPVTNQHAPSIVGLEEKKMTSYITDAVDMISRYSKDQH